MSQLQGASRYDVEQATSNVCGKLTNTISSAKNELKSISDHVKDRVLDRMNEIHRDDIAFMRAMLIHIEQLERSILAYDSRVKELGKSMSNLRYEVHEQPGKMAGFSAQKPKELFGRGNANEDSVTLQP